MTEFEKILHPGTRIKTEVIPEGMSVTKAAELIGVGRPALSNLLNGNASLSADMAARIEKAFNYPRKKLLDTQATYDAALANKKNAPENIGAYVPPYLGIKANQLDQWTSSNIYSRTRLSVFLRTLVHSTGRMMTKVDFPGNDDAERPGWDGFVETNEGTPWIPIGRSGWEFGTNQDINGKANDDFNKSVKALEQKERNDITFVFVTPHRWPGKSAWIKKAQAKKLWKDVRAYDASDLEQWIEQSIPAQAWFANETCIPAQDVRSLDKCWVDWAYVSTPPLTGVLFSSAIDASKRTILARLSRPSDGPIIIAADSTEEALAFLSQLFDEQGGKELSIYRDRTVVFDKPGTLPRLAQGAQTLIPVVYTREVERELAPYSKSIHSIVIYPRNAANVEPHIVLEPASYDAFNKALGEMGKSRDEITRLNNESGRSLTVLRRRVATLPTVKTPEWSADHKIAASLVPFLFVGAWHSANEADQTGLSLLAGDRSYPDLEKEFQSLTHLNDAPVWSIGTYRGVISKIDLLYAIAGDITPDDLKRYFSLARMVLGEDDPSLDLAEDQRWAAAIHGKKREFSGAFRKGISETLVLLAVHGVHLFKSRLGIDAEADVIRVIRDLLPIPLTTRVLEANDRDLPTYAEAAPDEFLSIIERDLGSDNPAVLSLMRPASSGIFGGSPSRTGLLWALEGLAWNPETLPRAAQILARLAQIKINDNWVNKPSHSLASIFRSWMPQTAASHEMRVNVIKTLAKRFPDVAWRLCVTQFSIHSDTGDYSHKPQWRSDGYGFGEPFRMKKPVYDFQREMIEMALSWEKHTLSTLSDLVERLPGLDDADQARIWTLIEEWARDKATDADKAAMQEKIRIATLSRQAALRANKSPRFSTLTVKAKAAYAALEPNDLLNKHAWLFRESWVQESADEIENIEELDFHKRDEKLQKMRRTAMKEIRAKHGFSGLLALAEQGKASWQIGVIAASGMLSEEELQDFLRKAFQPILEDKDNVYPFKNLIAGALCAISNNDMRLRILKNIAADLSGANAASLLLLSRFNKITWGLVDSFGEETQVKYWKEVAPDNISLSDEECHDCVERLLKAKRPRAAFSSIRLRPDKLDALVLFRLLTDLAKGGDDRDGEYPLEHYYVDEAFKYLNKTSALTLDQIAGLEFAFIDVLARPWDSRSKCYGTPNLERYVEAHPEVFVQGIVWAYKRKDDGADPVEFQVPSDRMKNAAERGYKLLEAMERIPGHNDQDELEADRLTKWIVAVRKSCAELSRGDIADLCLGKLLAHAPIGKDGVWPCEPVRQAMEECQSKHMMDGACNGVYNLRGAHWRGEGGGQERELADKYRKWGQALQSSYPFVSSSLLMRMAKTYEDEASYHDTEAGIRRRLR